MARVLIKPLNRTSISEANNIVPVANTPAKKSQWVDEYIKSGGKYKLKCKTPAGAAKGTCPKTLYIDSPFISAAKKTSHGAAIVLNNDWDCEKTYAAPGTAAHREGEPIFDKDLIEPMPNEDNLLVFSIGAHSLGKVGNAQLKINSGMPKIKIWKKPRKGVAADILVLPANIPLADLPTNFYIEGLQSGRAELEVTYTAAGVNLSDKLVVNVLELLEEQGGTRKVIYDYNSTIDFKVIGAPANYLFEWDLNGDGTFGTAAAETGRTVAQVSVRYAAANNATTVQLAETIANIRKIIKVAVKVTGGVTLFAKGLTTTTAGKTKGLRIALSKYVGTALPAQNTAGLHTIYNWNNNTPIHFDVLAGDPNVGAKRISYNAAMAPNARTRISGHGVNLKIYNVEIGPAIWTSHQTQDDLSGTVNHEIRHLNQFAAVRDNIPANNVWRLLDTHYGSVAGYLDFIEAQGHFSEVLDNKLSWAHQILNSQGDLALFRSRYNNCLRLYGAFPAGTLKNAVKALLLDMYNTIPFFDVKVSGYDIYIRAPQ